MARPRTPTNVLEARGSFKTHPERRRTGEPVVSDPIGEPPEYLRVDQIIAWQSIISGAPEGVLTAADALAVELAAVLMAEFRGSPAHFEGGKLTRLHALLGQFGMTPSERAKMSIGSKKPSNPFAGKL